MGSSGLRILHPANGKIVHLADALGAGVGYSISKPQRAWQSTGQTGHWAVCRQKTPVTDRLWALDCGPLGMEEDGSKRGASTARPGRDLVPGV